jgi:iron-sulfur cluster repair protein YtfE (RIC family)
MHATVSSYLEEDHGRIDMALRRATSSGDRIQPEAYAQFRGALLRRIGMEEKILFPAIRKATDGKVLPGMEQLHLDHGALAALLSSQSWNLSDTDLARQRHHFSREVRQ